MIQCNMNHYY